MNREIEFRVWNKASNSFLDLTEGEWGYYFITPNGKFMVHYTGGMGGFTDTKELDYVIIQQFSGLKDINGKKIYEGDLIEMDELDLEKVKALSKDEFHKLITNEIPHPMKRMIRPLIFDDGGFGFKGNIVECVKKGQHDSDYFKFSVVGNIFKKT